MRHEHLRAVIWPRGPIKEGKKTNYRYVVIGMLVTDEPIETLEGKNEVVVDGNPWTLSDTLGGMKQFKPARPLGDATAVLCSLEDIMPEKSDGSDV